MLKMTKFSYYCVGLRILLLASDVQMNKIYAYFINYYIFIV